MASFSLLPKPPIKGSDFYGNSFFISFIKFALILPVFLNISFFIAGRNSYGSVIRAPETPTVL